MWKLCICATSPREFDSRSEPNKELSTCYQVRILQTGRSDRRNLLAVQVLGRAEKPWVQDLQQSPSWCDSETRSEQSVADFDKSSLEFVQKHFDGDNLLNDRQNSR